MGGHATCSLIDRLFPAIHSHRVICLGTVTHTAPCQCECQKTLVSLRLLGRNFRLWAKKTPLRRRNRREHRRNITYNTLVCFTPLDEKGTHIDTEKWLWEDQGCHAATLKLLFIVTRADRDLSDETAGDRGNLAYFSYVISFFNNQRCCGNM